MARLKVLSIDFDYFQKVDKSTITNCYPDGIDVPTDVSSIIWSGYYANPKSSEQLQHVDILSEEFETLKSILTSNKNVKKSAPVMIANSHVHIYDFIHKMVPIFKADGVNIVNIDMHHDMFNETGNLDCGNWLSYITDDFKDNCNISWIANPTSIECYGFKTGELSNLPTSIQEIINCKFDIIFLCRSDNWLPPHLDIYFDELVQLIANRFKHISIEKCVQQIRNIQPMIDAQREILAKIMTN